MTFPVVEAVSRGNNNTNATSHNVAMPATVSAGDLLIILFATDGNPTVSRNNALAQSFTLLFVGNNGSNCKLVAFFKIADGSEDGQAAIFTTSAAERTAWQVYRISGAHALMPPVASAAATGTSTGPNAASVAPIWGSGDNLWLIAFGADAATADPVTHPTNYAANGIYDEANDAAGCGIGSSYRTNAAASEDAGAWTISASEQWVACAIAIAPAAQPTTPIRRAMAQSLSATCAKPTDTAEGDVMWASCFNVNNTTIPSTPAGWTLLTSGSLPGAPAAFAIFGKVAGASEPADYTFTNASDIRIVSFFGDTCDASDPFGADATTTSGQSATLTASGITTERDHAQLLLYASHQSDPTGTPFSPMVEIAGVTEPNTSLFEERQAAAGASGNRSASMTSGFWHTQLVSINPPAVVTTQPRFHAQLIG